MLIHITTEEQFNVAIRALEMQGFKPFEIGAKYKGECLIQKKDRFLIHPVQLISFEQFIKEVK